MSLRPPHPDHLFSVLSPSRGVDCAGQVSPANIVEEMHAARAPVHAAYLVYQMVHELLPEPSHHALRLLHHLMFRNFARQPLWPGAPPRRSFAAMSPPKRAGVCAREAVSAIVC